MSRRGNCWDNAPMERVFRSLKTEWIPTVAPERNREHSIRGSGSAFECVGDGSVTILSGTLQGWLNYTDNWVIPGGRYDRHS